MTWKCSRYRGTVSPVAVQSYHPVYRRAARGCGGMSTQSTNVRFSPAVSGGHRNGPGELGKTGSRAGGSGMRQGKRLTETERTELRERIAAGETFARAAAAVRCSTKSIYRLLTGSSAPTRRTTPRAALRLSVAEREEISRGVGAAESCRAIAQRLGRAPSTGARDIASTGGRRHYRAWRADAQAVRRSRRPKVPKLVGCLPLRQEVERRLTLRWSPQQIADRKS